jgi:hypothetical protein
MSTYTLYGEIIFPAHEGRQAFLIRRFSESKIESSWRSLTDTAEITIPRKVKDFDRLKVSEWFREGDPVEIWLGYDGNLSLEFQGYIKKVPAGIPLIIACEDEMYKLKRSTVSISKKDCTLKRLLNEIAPGYTVVCDDSKLGNVRFSKLSPSQILEDLQKNGIYCWFEGKELHAFGTSKSNVEPVDILVERTAAESLKQREIEKTLVIMSLIRKKGKKLRVEVGDKEAGKRITREISGIEISEAEMRREAEKLYELSKQPGLDGDLTLWGVPRVQHGYRMNLKSILYPEKNGTYYIDAVTKTFAPTGFRQVCKLGLKAS